MPASVPPSAPNVPKAGHRHDPLDPAVESVPDWVPVIDRGLAIVQLRFRTKCRAPTDQAVVIDLDWETVRLNCRTDPDDPATVTVLGDPVMATVLGDPVMVIDLDWETVRLNCRTDQDDPVMGIGLDDLAMGIVRADRTDLDAPDGRIVRSTTSTDPSSIRTFSIAITTSTRAPSIPAGGVTIDLSTCRTGTAIIIIVATGGRGQRLAQ